MTRITYDPQQMMIKAEGHAGYAEYGKDIVCAGVSALMQTLRPARCHRLVFFCLIFAHFPRRMADAMLCCQSSFYTFRNCEDTFTNHHISIVTIPSFPASVNHFSI